MAHESQHVFKDVDKRSQLKKKDFFTYGYLTDAEKIRKAIKANKNAILEKNKYEYVDRYSNSKNSNIL